MLLKCWLLLAIADHDAIHFGCVHDNQRLVNIIQAILVIDIYFSLGYKMPLIQPTLPCSLPPDPVVAT